MAFIFKVAVMNLVEVMQEILVEYEKDSIIKICQDEGLLAALWDCIPEL